MRILIFSTAYLPMIGGAEVAVKEITDRIGGIDFDMITARIDRKLPKFEKIGGINVYRIGWGLGAIDKFILPFFGYFKAIKLHKQNRYNLIWSIMASQASIAASFFKTAQPQIPLILNLQEGDEEEHLKRYAFGSDILYKLLIRPWHLLVFRKADFVTAISNYLRERALKNNIKCPVEIVPNGADLNKFKNQNSKIKITNQNLKMELGIKNEEKVIITVSRLVPKNGIGDLIEAVAYLNMPNIKLLILGIGPLEESLKSQVANHKLQDKVLFLGNILNEEVPSYLAIADVFVRPSLSEGLGNSFLEAMAAGVPVVGTNVGGIPDFLHDGKTGLFCEVRNPESIAVKVKILLENTDWREKIIDDAKKMVEENYDWDLIANKMENIFNKLI